MCQPYIESATTLSDIERTSKKMCQIILQDLISYKLLVRIFAGALQALVLCRHSNLNTQVNLGIQNEHFFLEYSSLNTLVYLGN